MENIDKQVVEKMKTFPDWLTEPTEKNSEGDWIWKLDLFGQEVEVKELNGSSYEAATSFAEKAGWDEMKVVMQRSVVDMKVLELDDLRGRKYLRLKGAMAYVYGFNDF